MVRVASALLILLLSHLPAYAEDDLSLRVEIETEAETPHVQEMVRIVIKGAYKVPITLEVLEQPDLEGFGWMQLGEDKWFESTERGVRVVNLERRMALFPERAGTLEIGAFEHKLTLSRPNGQRYERSIFSEPITVTVADPPASDNWWFPVHEIEINDGWSNAPQALGPDESGLRKVVLTVGGTQPEMVPPMPEMTGTGVVILPHPEKRITVLRQRGPITRVFWRWTIRPEDEFTGYVDPLDITYFDAKAREMRTVTLSAQRVGYVGASDPEIGLREDTGAPDRALDDPSTMTGAGWQGFGALGTGFTVLLGLFGGIGLALRIIGPSSLTRDAFAKKGSERATLRALRKAVHAGDALAVRRIASEIVKKDDVRLRGNAARTVLSSLDKTLFSASDDSALDLQAFFERFQAARQQDAKVR